ncbi:TraB/GumN family protein [Haloferula sargassicola]|uniref:TraB/GumN family protein n=1 Tax=Haloferula sargassicola TaxID=490096 RepID=A0ABP9ULF2_9BACT
MKRLLRLCLAGLAIAGLTAPAWSADEAPEHPAKPMLWRVEGGKLAKPSWLFGTIHLGTGPVGTLHPAAEKALESSDALYTELEMDPVTQLGLAKHFIRTDGRKLSDSIGEEMTEQLEAELKKIMPALNSAVLQSFKTWAVAIMLPTLKLQLEGAPPLDMIVWKKAEDAGIATRALEKPEDQFDIFDDLTEDEQVIMLSETLRQLREARDKDEDLNDELIAAYVSGDDQAVLDWMNRYYQEMIEGEHAELGKKLMKRMLDDRNAKMAATIISALQTEPDQSHFFAAGTAHFLGKNNIGGYLTKQGYKVTRVTE